MKIVLKMEDGKPAIFFPDEPAKPGRVLCFAGGEHNEASRAYMRQLAPPRTTAERLACWRALGRYCQGFTT